MSWIGTDLMFYFFIFLIYKNIVFFRLLNVTVLVLAKKDANFALPITIQFVATTEKRIATLVKPLVIK